MRQALLLLCVLCVVGCAPRGQMSFVEPAAATGPVKSIFVATSRAFDTTENTFGSQRSETVSFARYDVAIPPDRDPGSITYPRRGATVDPDRDFATTAAVIYPAQPAFRRDLTAAMRTTPGGGREATIFVHGYNTTYSEGIYRIAQLSQDLSLPGVTMHFAWPSAATPFGYVYDRDSTVVSRSGLEAMLREAAASGADRILLVGHSMGSLLVMEALRQLAIRGDQATLRKISAVMLISPDLDVDVFRAQVRDIGKLPEPFLIFGSDRDRALKLSATLTGQKARLGSLDNIGAVADLPVTFVDVKAFNVGDGHFNVGNSPALIALLGRIGDVDAAFEADRVNRIGLISGAVLTAQSATQIILSPVAAVGIGLQQ